MYQALVGGPPQSVQARAVVGAGHVASNHARPSAPGNAPGRRTRKAWLPRVVESAGPAAHRLLSGTFATDRPSGAGRMAVARVHRCPAEDRTGTCPAVADGRVSAARTERRGVPCIVVTRASSPCSIRPESENCGSPTASLHARAGKPAARVSLPAHRRALRPAVPPTRRRHPTVAFAAVKPSQPRRPASSPPLPAPGLSRRRRGFIILFGSRSIVSNVPGADGADGLPPLRAPRADAGEELSDVVHALLHPGLPGLRQHAIHRVPELPGEVQRVAGGTAGAACAGRAAAEPAGDHLVQQPAGQPGQLGHAERPDAALRVDAGVRPGGRRRPRLPAGAQQQRTVHDDPRPRPARPEPLPRSDPVVRRGAWQQPRPRRGRLPQGAWPTC